MDTTGNKGIVIFEEMLSGPRPIHLSACPIRQDLRLLVLAPHPDDFDEIGVTLKFFRDNGNPIFVSVLSSGAGGVEDEFCPSASVNKKAAVREQEQRESCKFFGLPDTHLEFHRLVEDRDGHILDNAHNFKRIRHCVNEIRPALVFLPHGNDTNMDHRLTYEMFTRVAVKTEFPLAAFLNRDPKTINMRYDFYTPFGPDEAEWKAVLLRFHVSQQARNLNTRSMGFDERILEVNRQVACECPGNPEYAEAFEYSFWE